MTSAQVNGITIEFEVHGEGTPLLLVMGLGGQLVSWPPGFVDTLVARGFQVIVFDNRDSGLSTKGTMAPPPIWRQLAAILSRRFARSEYLLSDMADDAFGLLDHLGIRQAQVAGMSMGGMIVQSMAIARPERVLSLTSIMSTTGDRRVGRVAPALLRRLPKLIREDKSAFLDNQVELFRLISGPAYDEVEARAVLDLAMRRSYCPDGTVRQTLAIAASPDRTPALRRLDVPALVIHGLVDPLVRPSGGIATAEAIPGARLLMFPDMATTSRGPASTSSPTPWRRTPSAPGIAARATPPRRARPRRAPPPRRARPRSAPRAEPPATGSTLTRDDARDAVVRSSTPGRLRSDADDRDVAPEPQRVEQRCETFRIARVDDVARLRETRERGVDDIDRARRGQEDTSRSGELVAQRADVGATQDPTEHRLTCGIPPDLTDDAGMGDQVLA